MMRRIGVWLHRWVGLLMAIFLILEGLTGSVLAFRSQIERLCAPELYATHLAGRPPLDLATLAQRAETQMPQASVGYFSIDGDVAVMHMRPRVDPATGRQTMPNPPALHLDPWTGQALRADPQRWLSRGGVELLALLYRLHMNLATGEIGGLVLGIVALAWTVDCFIGLYLTLPTTSTRWLPRWAPAWGVKLRSSAFRIQFDVHRASGLWMWPLLFILAWSSVMFNLSAVYEPVMTALFDYRSDMADYTALAATRRSNPQPALGWREAQAAGERLMARQALLHGFRIERPYGMAYLPDIGVYTYAVVSDLNIQAHGWSTSLWLDGNSGALVELDLPSGRHAGNTVEAWLRALHFADWRDSLAYRTVVCLAGVVITALSLTGIYVWYRKRQGRRARRQAPP